MEWSGRVFFIFEGKMSVLERADKIHCVSMTHGSFRRLFVLCMIA